MTIQHIIELIAIVMGSNWLGSFLLQILQEHKKKKTPLEEMILALGRDRLLYLAKKYRDGIPADEYENFYAMFTAYLKLGGNSQVKKRCEEVLKKPLKEV